MDFRIFKEKYQKVEPKELANNTSSKPLVSVCVQTYQHKDFIRDCLEGILMQKTDFSYEILIGEDGSTDGTREICLEYFKRFPDKIRLFSHHRENNIHINGKPTGRFNFVYNFFSGRGKYIAICEGDDNWTDPLNLQKQVELLEANPQFSFAFHDVTVINKDGKILRKGYLKDGLRNNLEQKVLKRGPDLLLSTICFRTNALHFPREFFKVPNGDTFLISLLGNQGKGGYLATIKNSFYRHHSGGVWSLKTELFKSRGRLLTYFYLGTFYKKKNDTEISDYFLEKFLKERDLILNSATNMQERGQLVRQFYHMKKNKAAFWFFLYNLTHDFNGRGNIFKRNFLRNMSSF
ncbi:glycosyltransferase family 2 protein [Christiangramia portivictoriae]|uniref:glycosyltransferase family 2 protein n=1 Tax=Christiangramia portivictoriae TaxID=326069 RepID=UPI0003FACF5F|nr:glycosyltransferase [Christiangramia portivictoriae]